MDDMLDMLMGVDKKNEIFNLWYEVTFLRLLFCQALGANEQMAAVITPECIAECRKEAQKQVQERFPVVKIDFSEPSPEHMEKRKKHLEDLHKLNATLGGIVGEPAPIVESEQESPCCTPQDYSESPPVSQTP